MKILIACKRGNVAERDKWGHCLCADCKAYAKEIASRTDRAEYHRKWRQDNPDKCSSYSKKWNAANAQQRREIEKSWRQRNPEKVKAMNARGGSKWAKNNKGIRNASVKRRVVAKLHRTPPWADLIKIRQFYIEAECKTAITGIPHEVDHVVPLQGETVSGLHNQFNLQVLPRSANRSKHNRMEVTLSAS